MPFDIFRNLLKPKNEALKLVKQGAILIDVRTKNEYEAGHIKGSRNIPLNEIETELIALKKLKKPVVIVCRSGHRSAMAMSLLSDAGIHACNGGSWTNLKKQLDHL